MKRRFFAINLFWITLFLFFVVMPMQAQEEKVQEEPSPRQQVQALFSREGLAKIFSHPFVEGSSEHFRCWSDDEQTFASQVTSQTEASVKKLGELLEEDAIFSLVPKIIHVIAFNEREDYVRVADILAKARVVDEMTADLFRVAASFGLNTPQGYFLIAHLDTRRSEDWRAGFVAHNICEYYLNAWKTPETGGRPLPPWLQVGVILLVDMRMVEYGGYYAIAYGKKEAKDAAYRDRPQRDNWLREWKTTKDTRADLNEAFAKHFNDYTHENRMQAWIACETLLHRSKRGQRGLLPSLVETIKTGIHPEAALKEVTKWDLRRFLLLIEDWTKDQKTSADP